MPLRMRGWRQHALTAPVRGLTNPGHHQECCQRNPCPAKHVTKDLADMCKLDHSGQRTERPTQQVHPAENAKVKEYLQNRPPVIFADPPDDGMHTSVGHNLYTQMRAFDGSMTQRVPDATSVDVHQDLPEDMYTWKPYSTAIDPLMIERAPGVTLENIDQHRVCGVASVSFNADFTKLTPSQDMVFLTISLSERGDFDNDTNMHSFGTGNSL